MTNEKILYIRRESFGVVLKMQKPVFSNKEYGSSLFCNSLYHYKVCLEIQYEPALDRLDSTKEIITECSLIIK